MSRSRLLVVALTLSLFAGIVSGSAAAQSIKSAGAAGGQALANEITAVGTIRQVLSEPAPGRPQGLNLVVASPQGVFNVSAGPYLGSDVKDSLSVGQQVQIVGVARSSSGQTLLLAREMNVAGRQVTIRNQHGFLVRAALPAGSTSPRSQAGLNGGKQ